jgi:hypothetical protein
MLTFGQRCSSVGFADSDRITARVRTFEKVHAVEEEKEKQYEKDNAEKEEIKKVRR